MPKSRILAFAAIFAFASLHAAAEQYLFLSHSGDAELRSYVVNPKTGALKKHASLALTGTGGPMTFTRDGRRLYLQGHAKKEDGKRAEPQVFSLTVKGGKARQTHVAPIKARTPAIHVDDTGALLLGAHYGTGSVSVWEIDEKGNCSGKLLQEIETAPRAHFITTDSSNRFAYVPHTSPNAVYQFALDLKAKRLRPLDPPFAEGPDKDHRYHEPRHYVQHPTLPMGYTSNERGGGVSAWSFDAKTGRLALRQTLLALPDGYDGNGAAADVHLTPNGKFVYVSNRDYTPPRKDPGVKRRDSIAAFRIHPETGLLTRIGTFPTEHAPRSFCIDRSGRFLYAAGQHVNKLAAYRIDQETGALERFATYQTAATPIWVTCLED